MTTAPTNCLTCSEWLRTDDPCVGLCRKLQHYTFQLEGDDCVLFAFGESRERSGYTELPKPKAVVSGHWTPVIEQNIERIRAWKAEGRSYAWMAQKLGVPIRSSSLVSRCLRTQGGV